METLRNGHEAYGLTEKRLGEIYKCKVRAMITRQRLKLWSKEAAILEGGKMKTPTGYRRGTRYEHTETTVKCHCSTPSGKMIVLLLRKVRG